MVKMVAHNELVDMIHSLQSALKDDVKDKTIRRIVIQDFLMGLNRRSMLTNEQTPKFIDYALEGLTSD